MSWIDRIQNTQFTITTGDGKLWTPDFISGEVSKQFNAGSFNFINLPGTLVVRKQVQARKFPLIFWFQGEDNLDNAEAFDQSANDSRAWVINHPQYGSITGQPVSLSRNDTHYNATEINVEFWETMIKPNPVLRSSVYDSLSAKMVTFQIDSSIDYGSKVLLKPADLGQINKSVSLINARRIKAITTATYSQYQMTKNAAALAVLNIITAPVDGIHAIQNLIAEPARYDQMISSRVNLIASIFNDLLSAVTNTPTVNNKYYFQAAAGVALAAIALAVVTPFSAANYLTRTAVAGYANALTGFYNTYLSTLDNLYVSLPNPAGSFSATAATQNQLQTIIIEALTGLDTIAFSAKQERITTLLQDDNLITLTHKYMGLDVDDANLETFRTINNIKNDYLFLIPKGTQIKYYV